MTRDPRTWGEHLPPMSDAEIIRRLERRPYDRACREAARRLRELTRPRR